MSRKTPIKEMSSEEAIDSPFPIRRSSRISLTQNSPAPKTVSTRRSSASDRTNSESTSPVLEKRKTRRASTDTDSKPTPIKTRRTSASMLIEEAKSVTASSSPITRRNTRATSSSPSTLSDVPARRTRRSVSKDQDPIEEIPARRTRSRKPSTENVEETEENPAEKDKSVTRRRRSSSVDEQEETIKPDASKPKTKRLFSEDNQLEPIEEQETEIKENISSTETITAKTPRNKSKNNLSIIEEKENPDEALNVETSLDEKMSPIPEKVSTRSVFSPITPKRYSSSKKDDSLEKEVESSKSSLSLKSADNTPKKNDSVSKSPEKSTCKSPEKLDKSKSNEDNKNQITEKPETVSSFSKNNSPEKCAISSKNLDSPMNSDSKIDLSAKTRPAELENKVLISMGSGDSFTLNQPETVSPISKNNSPEKCAISNEKLDSSMNSDSKIDLSAETRPAELKDKVLISMGSDDSFTLNQPQTVSPISKNNSPEKCAISNEKLDSPMNSDSKIDLSAKTRPTELKDKVLISMGSDDSFTLNLNTSTMNETQFSTDQNNENVFTSPGSDKENSSLNVPRPSPLKKTKTATTEQNIISDEISSFTQRVEQPTSNVSSKSESYEEASFNESKKTKKLDSECMEVAVENIKENMKSSSMDNISLSDERGRMKEAADAEKRDPTDEKKETISCNLEDDTPECITEIQNSPSSSRKSPRLSNQKANILSCVKIVDETEEDMSSDISIKLVDTDEEIEEILVAKKEPEKAPCIRRSKRPRMSDGTSKRTHLRLQAESTKGDLSPECTETIDIVSDDSNQKEVTVEMRDPEETLQSEPDFSKTLRSSDISKGSPQKINSDSVKTNDMDNLQSIEPENKNSNIKQVSSEKSSPRKSITGRTSLNKAKERSFRSTENETLETYCETNKKIDLSENSELAKNQLSEENNIEQIRKKDVDSDETDHDRNDSSIGKTSEKDKKKPLSPDYTYTKSKLKLDKKMDNKLNDILSRELENVESDQDCPSDSMSEDYEPKNEFLDDMAEECEEDTPSEGSNDIIDEGESINSTESELDSDESYDLEDSFLVEDEEAELLSGQEYDIEMDEAVKKKEQAGNTTKPKRRSRIIQQVDSSEEEVQIKSPKVSFSEKFEIIEEKKYKDEKPAKQISVKKSPVATSQINNEETKQDIPKLKKGQDNSSFKKENERSPKKSNNQLPDIEVHLVDTSEEEVENEIIECQDQKTPFENKLRSLVQLKKSSTPNTSLSEIMNSSRQSNSGKSSSIIIQENVSINELKEDFLVEKLQTVVKAFCSTIKSSDGNISINVSLDYVDNQSTSNYENTKNISYKDENNLPKTAQEKSKELNTTISPQKNTKKRLSQAGEITRNETAKVLSTETIGQDTSEVKDEQLKKRRSSNLKNSHHSTSFTEKRLSKSNIEGEKKSLTLSPQTIESALSNSATGNSHKKRRSLKLTEPLVSTVDMKSKHSKKLEKSLNIPVEIIDDTKDDGEWKSEKQEEHSVEDVEGVDNGDFEVEAFLDDLQNESDHNRSNNKKKRNSVSLKVNDEVESSDENTKRNDSQPEKSEQRKLTKNKRKKRKAEKSLLEELNPGVMNTKRSKMLEMKCEELSADDLRHRIPSQKEATSTKESQNLKKLKSKLLGDARKTLKVNLVTDVKNRPRRLIKPSTAIEKCGWVVKEDSMKPSATNPPKCSFNYKKLDSKDFKNQMLYDPRIKREATTAFLRKKGHFI